MNKRMRQYVGIFTVVAIYYIFPPNNFHITKFLIETLFGS